MALGLAGNFAGRWCPRARMIGPPGRSRSLFPSVRASLLLLLHFGGLRFHPLALLDPPRLSQILGAGSPFQIITTLLLGLTVPPTLLTLATEVVASVADSLDEAKAAFRAAWDAACVVRFRPRIPDMICSP
jgi:hypothetical protein